MFFFYYTTIKNSYVKTFYLQCIESNENAEPYGPYESLKLDNIFRTIQIETAILKDYTYSEIYLWLKSS